MEPTLEIEQLEKVMLKEILKCDATILSGLALGCDSIAHKSVSSQNCTIAVLPSTLDNVLPKENRKLASEIVSNKLELNETAIKNFNTDIANRDFKIITKRNAKSIIKSLRKWKDKQGLMAYNNRFFL